MRISEVAARSGLSTSTLRYYDSIGLIAARREANGYRTYDEAVLEQLSFVDEAKQLDLPLRELDQRLAVLEQLRRRLSEATSRVRACPDHSGSCRSECMLAAAGQMRA